MKKITALLILVAIVLVSCKNTTTEPSETQNPEAEVVSNEIVPSYPASMVAIFEAHGGMNKWNGMESLTYDFLKGDQPEAHTVSLKDRRVRIDHDQWSIGFDGRDVWLLEHEEGTYKGNARFYHNLYFYFYAMPFVLGDDGITYEKVETTQLLDKEYEGIKISYGDGVGDSPKDEYILYYDAETNRMEWLGYTVTYKSNEKSDSWSFIRYSEWATVNGLLLPKKLTWYTSEDNRPGELRSEREFLNVQLDTQKKDDAVFEIPETAKVIER